MMKRLKAKGSMEFFVKFLYAFDARLDILVELAVDKDVFVVGKQCVSFLANRKRKDIISLQYFNRGISIRTFLGGNKPIVHESLPSDNR